MDGKNHYRNVASHGSALKWCDDKQGARGIPIKKMAEQFPYGRVIAATEAQRSRQLRPLAHNTTQT